MRWILADDQVEKLLKNPTREIAMPEATTYKALVPPPEMVKNINGSASGAGSGEFHVYKHARKREHERLKQMEEKARDVSDGFSFPSILFVWICDPIDNETGP